MGVYRDLATVAQAEDWDVKYHIVDAEKTDPFHALSLQKSWNPISIKEREWRFIRNFVSRTKLYNGYELATGVGLSCIAAGLGMKDNLSEFTQAPRLVTMDAFIEENRHSSLSYATDEPQCYWDSDGYKSVNNLIKHFGLEQIVIPKVGWSPDDTTCVLSKVYDLDHEKLDYIFIDGQHYWKSVKDDIDSILPYLNRDKYALFLHDTHAPELGDTLYGYLQSVLGRGYEVCPRCGFEDHCYNLSIVTNIEVDLGTILTPGE
jgi:hypothetical protein